MQEKLRRFKAGIFQSLAHRTRIAIVEMLRDEGELPVTVIYERLGLEQANISQHLAVLRSKHLVVARKTRNQVYYSLRDPILGKVLDLMRQYFHSHLTESLDLLRDMQIETKSTHQLPGRAQARRSHFH
jgi:DNA-binding transcriptional ArsR family regulator